MSLSRSTNISVPQTVTIALIILCQFGLKSCMGAFVDDHPPNPRVPHRLSLVDVHARCEGLCYYFDDKGFDATGECTKNGDKVGINCDVIFSIVKFTPTCGPPTLRLPYLEDLFCNETRKGNNIYKVTLARRVDYDNCPQGKYGTFCLRPSYVSVVFSDKQDDVFEETNPLYICAANERSVQSWHRNVPTRTEPPSFKVNNTTPFETEAVGVLWSKIVEPDGEGSLLCTFYLSDGLYSYTGRNGMNQTFQLKSPGPSGWYIKLSTGLVQRNISTVNVLGASGFIIIVYLNADLIPSGETKTNCRPFISLPSYLGVESVCLAETYGLPTGTSFTLADIDAKTPTRKPSPTTDAKVNLDNINAMSVIHKECMEMKRFCYVFTHERGCLHREMCHTLLAIRQSTANFGRLHFDIISHSADLPGVVKYVRPTGWAAIAFSTDERMGDDFVVTCAYYGTLSNIGISINLAGTNLYFNDQPYQSLLMNKVVRVGKKDSELEPRVMCSFDMNTANFTISKQPFARETLQFSFTTQEYFVFMAYGTTVTSKWEITYHTFQEVIRRKFSRKNYEDEVARGHKMYNCGSSLCKILLAVLVLIVNRLC